MRGIRFVVGRLRSSAERAVQSIVFDSHEFSERDARAWLDEHGFKARALDRDGRWWRSRQREPREFESGSLRTVETGRREVVTMASNPKRRGKKRRAPKKRRSARARRKVSASSRRHNRIGRLGAYGRKRRRIHAALATNTRARRRRRAKTVRTKVTTVRVMRTNARKRRARPRRSTRYTLAFAPAALKAFARIARLSKTRRREMRRALRRHPSGGIFVALPAWHGSREQALRLQRRVQLILAYAAGRRRASLMSSAAPRVVAVP